ncbi:hypothetical protein BJV82DRAFT_576598 [Fennellomyces sp. T-0311]|nr:hypothetical protein BJV82DRAFT_576598 [Fennellomyces sp. T-0311]
MKLADLQFYVLEYSLAYHRLASLPFFDEINPASIDVSLVTHFHMHHDTVILFKGYVFMTPSDKSYLQVALEWLRVRQQLEDRADQLTFEWYGNAVNGMASDSALVLVLAVDSSPASAKSQQ